MENKTGKQKKQIGMLGIAGIMLASSLTVMVGNAITPALPALLCPMRRRFLSTGFSWGRRQRRL